MKKDLISYYCFNKQCHGSVYFSKSVLITDLTLSEETLSNDHHCIFCSSKLISLIDIELRQSIGVETLDVTYR